MSSEELLAAARLAQGDDPAAARPLIARLLAAQPHDADALTLLGLVAERTGDEAGALDAFGRARANDPANPARLGNHAVALKRAGRFDEAIAALQHSLEIRPNAAVTLANLGSCLIAADRPNEAEAPLRAAIAVKPDHAEAWNNLGVALARTARAGESCAAYRRALAIRPGYAEASLNLADALAANGAASEAQALASAVLRADPANRRAANITASLLDRQGALEEAVGVYRAALDPAAPDQRIGVNLAMALLRLGRPEEVLELADVLVAAFPSITTPLALKCAALDRLERHDELDMLMGTDRFVQVIDIDDVPGFETRSAFDAALVAELRAHPSLTFEPEGLVTRGGRQSDELAQAVGPALAALAQLAAGAIGRYLVRVTGDDHVFLRARPDQWSLTLWGTILAPGGSVDAHIHAPNWVSGVYYPALPEVLRKGTEGWFAVGALPETLGGGGTLRIFEPKPGRMILFPSYLWHATLPFGGTEERISFAFDCVPTTTGRPHSLQK